MMAIPVRAGGRHESATPRLVTAGTGERALREEISRLRGLLALSMLMTERRDVDEILHVATTAIPALAPVRPLGVHLSFSESARWHVTTGPLDQPAVRAAVLAQLRCLPGTGGAVAVPGLDWCWSFGLPGRHEQIGSLIVAAIAEPAPDDLLLLRSLAQQTGIALANARLHVAHAAANDALVQTVSALQRTTAIHDRFTRVAVDLAGHQGVVDALYELTGLAAAVEDGAGQVVATAGPEGVRVSGATFGDGRAEAIAQATRSGGPVRRDDRLLIVARPHPDVVGVLMLVDPDGRAGHQEEVALEHGATVLAIELARLHALAETELRLGRNLIADLIDGDCDDAAARAQALGHDLHRANRVVVVAVDPTHASTEAVALRVRDRLAGTTTSRAGCPPPLLTHAGQTIVVLLPGTMADSKTLPDLLREAGRGARMGVSGVCRVPADIARAHRDAHVALRLAQTALGGGQIVHYDDIGVYQLLSDASGPDSLDEYVGRWLGALLAHDDRQGSDLVATLAAFLEVGGNYDAAARRLTLGRSTVRYRMRRIQEVSGHDLTDPDTRFQLQLAARAWQTATALRRT